MAKWKLSLGEAWNSENRGFVKLISSCFFGLQTMYNLHPSSPTSQSIASRSMKLFSQDWRRTLLPENVFVTNSFVRLLAIHWPVTLEKREGACTSSYSKKAMFTNLPSAREALIYIFLCIVIIINIFSKDDQIARLKRRFLLGYDCLHFSG